MPPLKRSKKKLTKELRNWVAAVERRQESGAEEGEARVQAWGQHPGAPSRSSPRGRQVYRRVGKAELAHSLLGMCAQIK